MRGGHIARLNHPRRVSYLLIAVEGPRACTSTAEICKAARLLTMQCERGLAALCLGNTRAPCLLVRGDVQGSASFVQLGLALQCET